MRLLLAGFTLVLAISLSAQVAPDIARGTPAAEVIRLHGWPKGKSVTDGRESWMYERFQVLFEDGRVVNVTVQLSPPPKSSAPPRRTVPTAPIRPTTPQRTAPTTRPVIQSRSLSPGTNRPPPSPARPSKPAVNTGIGTGPNFLLLLLALPILGLIVALGRAVARMRRSAAAAEHLGENDSSARSFVSSCFRTWEDDVAERLSKLTPIPPVLSRTAVPATDAREPARDLDRDLLMALEWKRFELLVARTFSATGIRAELTCTGADGGVDIYLYRHDEGRPYSYVQCKAWAASKLVTVDDMRAFFGAMASDKVAEGFYVTTSDFTPPARDFAILNGITALSGTQFLARFQELLDGDRHRILAEVTAGDYTTPTCPNCDVKLVWRENGQFWGCRRFPRCSVKIYRRK